MNYYRELREFLCGCDAHEYVRWMVKEKDRIFVKEYENASLQYQNISRT